MQSIQLISRIDNNRWWKDLFIHYASMGETFEIRCWDEEIESINLISKFGTVEKSKTTKEIIIASISKEKIKYLYSVITAILFIPSVFIYYNESALIHSLWYMVVSAIGLLIGTAIYKLTHKK